MDFFWNFNHPKGDIAFINNSKSITYGELQNKIESIKHLDSLQYKKKLIFLLSENTIESMCAYLAALQMKHVICLIPTSIEKNNLFNLIKSYKPEWIIAPTQLIIEDLYTEIVDKKNRFHYFLKNCDTQPIHNDVALLLCTSGSTGSTKMVKLSYTNLQENAKSIVRYMKLTNIERPVLTLPMFYSFGLSIINSHLLAGASMLLPTNNLTSKKFWDESKYYNITSISGVPYTYQILEKIKFNKIDIKSLKTMTQAGGKVNSLLRNYINSLIKEKKIDFYYMYGQTEATARISFLPPEKALLKGDSIGYAIPGGLLDLDNNNQLIYKGPNVMLGYSNNRRDLEKGDELFGVLETGDIGEVDEDGFFYIRGRIKRIAKLSGNRINLDEIESLISDVLKTSCYCISNDEQIFILTNDDNLNQKIISILVGRYGISKSWIAFFNIDESCIPRLINGKVNYTKLKEIYRV